MDNREELIERTFAQLSGEAGLAEESLRNLATWLVDTRCRHGEQPMIEPFLIRMILAERVARAYLAYQAMMPAPPNARENLLQTQLVPAMAAWLEELPNGDPAKEHLERYGNDPCGPAHAPTITDVTR